MLITRGSRVADIPCTLQQLDAWARGALIQVAMPNLTEDEREFLLTGMVPGEWEELFGEEEE